MSNEQTLKMTELDYLTAAPHLQMIKAALPYINIQEQRIFSLLVKIGELERTVQLFEKRRRRTGDLFAGRRCTGLPAGYAECDEAVRNRSRTGFH